MYKWLMISIGAALLSAGYAQDTSSDLLAQERPYKRQYSEEKNSPYGYGYERHNHQSQSRDERHDPYARGGESNNESPSHHGLAAPHLSDQEEKFASWLSPLHKKVFTQVFTPNMRSSAMKLASFKFYDMEGPASSISPDQAVEILMSKFRYQTAQSGQNRRGCINPNKTPYKKDYSPRGSESQERGSRYGAPNKHRPKLSPYSN